MSTTGIHYEEPESWNEEAGRFADTVRMRMPGSPRGVVRVCGGIAVVFGHDYRDRERAERAIADVRTLIASSASIGGEFPAMQELGFGIDRLGGTWAIMVRTDEDGPAEDDPGDCISELQAYAGLWGVVLHEEGGHDIDDRQFSALVSVAFVAKLGFPWDDEPEIEADFDVNIR